MLGVVVYTVVTTSRKVRRYDFTRSSTNDNPINTSESASITFTIPPRASQRSSTRVSNVSINSNVSNIEREVVVQCLLYGCTLCNSVCWAVGASIMRIIDNNRGTTLLLDHFWIYILTVTFLPLQGFFNFCIFIRPRYLHFRKHVPNKWRLWTIANVIWNPSMNVQQMAIAARRQELSDSKNRGAESAESALSHQAVMQEESRQSSTGVSASETPICPPGT